MYQIKLFNNRNKLKINKDYGEQKMSLMAYQMKSEKL